MMLPLSLQTHPGAAPQGLRTCPPLASGRIARRCSWVSACSRVGAASPATSERHVPDLPSSSMPCSTDCVADAQRIRARHHAPPSLHMQMHRHRMMLHVTCCPCLRARKCISACRVCMQTGWHLLSYLISNGARDRRPGDAAVGRAGEACVAKGSLVPREQHAAIACVGVGAVKVRACTWTRRGKRLE